MTRAMPPTRRLRALCLAAASVLLAPAAAAHAQPPPTTPAFADEFTGTTLDLTRWSHRLSGVKRNDGTFTPDAVSVGGGALTIKTTTVAGVDGAPDQHFSGMIGTFRNGAAGFEQRYGYFEARMRFRSTPGQWSAFWLQSPTIGIPIGDPAAAGTEMDIAEHRAECVTAPAPTPAATCGPGNDITDRIQSAQVWDGYAAGVSKAAVSLSDPLPGLGNGSFHTYALRWTPDDLTFYVDDAEVWSQTSPISRRSQYLILSSEVGAFFAGAIPAGGYGSSLTSTTDMQVDYVRVWALPTAPSSTGAPTASGTPAVGGTLACSPGSWSGDPAPVFDYQWLRDGAAIAGAAAAAASYTVSLEDQGHALSCRVTARNVAGTASARSDELRVPDPPPPPILPRTLAPAPPPPPAIDRLAPGAVLSGSRSQRLGTTVAVTIACPDEACLAAAAGAVRVPRVGRARARTFSLAAPRAAIARGGRLTVRLRLSRAARGAMRRALRAGRRITVTVEVEAADRAGNVRALTRRIALRL